MKFNFSLILLILLVFSACKKPNNFSCVDKNIQVLINETFEENAKPESFKNQIFILNEGGFTNGNASISAYDIATNTVTNNVFQNVNEYQLGDIVQSISRKDDFLYIVVNNSQKIEIVKETTFESYKTIAGLSSPRYISFQDETKFLLTDLYENNIKVLDNEQNCSVKNIITEGWTEEIFKIGNFFWIIERNGIGVEDKFANLLKINAANYEIAQRIGIPVEPNSIVLDNDDNIWILSSGIENENKAQQLIKVNTATSQVEKTFTFNGFTDIAQNLAFNKNNNKLYYNKANFIYSMPTSFQNLPTQALFQSNASIVYNIAIHPENNDIYISDAVDFVSQGKVLRYNSSGTLLDELQVGFLPSKILF